MRTLSRLGLHPLLLSGALALLGAAAAGCAADKPGMPGDEETDTTPHALGTITLGETHQAGSSSSRTMVSAGFVPDAQAVKKCTKTIAGCEMVEAPKCGDGPGTGCQRDEYCAHDDACRPTCKRACTARCGPDEECYFASPGTPSCRRRESFDAGALAFSGTTTPITLFPPYVYMGMGTGAPFLAGAEITVQGSGATGAGFDRFEEKFKATAFVQSSPSLDEIGRSVVFGQGDLPVRWAPG